ncbi:neuropeptides B/W receptor type 1 [Microcaecilia unicolor]|uniref:Neuropeptides B/W receptor type 1 n=1 Tax=Microcaecilia unicolor TaxID=1415580 RepID=A0A6P7WP78_9AMPH|nr:neuropeptides B/W receptor type 1 [Microcaecilia unicolor]
MALITSSGPFFHSLVKRLLGLQGSFSPDLQQLSRRLCMDESAGSCVTSSKLQPKGTLGGIGPFSTAMGIVQMIWEDLSLQLVPGVDMSGKQSSQVKLEGTKQIMETATEGFYLQKKQLLSLLSYYGMLHNNWDLRCVAKMDSISLNSETGNFSINSSCADAVLNCNTESPYGLNESSPMISNFYLAVPLIYSVICAVGLTGNTAVIYVILKAPNMKTVTNMFILNLAIADELFTLVLPINIADYLLLQWPFGEFMCKLIISIDQYNIFSSIYFLTVMSIDRYLVVVATVKSKKISYRTYRAAKTVSLCVWMFVTVIILPFIIFAKIHDEYGRLQCVFVFPNPESTWWQMSRIYTLIMGFTIPVSTICILYTMMLYKLRHMHLNTNAKALDKAKKKVTFMVLIILAVCLFCWTPYHLSTVVALTTDIPQTPLVIGISFFITSLSYANSCLNPFLYAFLDDNFRKSFRKLVECRTSQ